jgi:hypothetical protein
VQIGPEPEIQFGEIYELAGLRRWLEAQFFNVMYGYDPKDPGEDDEFQPLPTHIRGFYLSSTTILGPIRLRQLRVRANSCKVCPPALLVEVKSLAQHFKVVIYCRIALADEMMA